MSKIFRHDAIEKLSSPTQLSKLLVVVRLRGWIVLSTLMAILLAIIIWSIVGQIPIITSGQAILLAPEAQFVVKSPNDSVVNQVFVKVGQEIQTGTPIMRLASGAQITAPHDGHVFQFDASAGEPVKVGDPLFWFQTAVFPNQLEVYGFIPAGVGERIQAGMHVTFDLNAVDTQKYGQLVGKVTQVAPYAVSTSSNQLDVIPSEKAKEDLTQGATMELIIIQPQLNSSNPSGLQWTFGKGPKERLDPGSMGTVRVTIENKRPISYLIPGV